MTEEPVPPADDVPCTCAYGWSETARRVALLSFDPDCQHCRDYNYFGIRNQGDIDK